MPMTQNDSAGRLHGATLYILRYVNMISYACFALYLCACHTSLIAQDKIDLSLPSLKFLNDRLIIKYNITGSEPDDRFHVWLEITDSTGHEITAHTLYGDIGAEVSGGLGKQIIWDLAADSLYLNSDVNVEIFATRIVKPVPQTAEKTEESRPEVKTDSIIKRPTAEKTEENYPGVKTDSVIAQQTAEKTEESRPEVKTDSIIKRPTAEKTEENYPGVKTDSVIVQQTAEKPVETKTDTVVTEKAIRTEPDLKGNATGPAPEKNAPEKKEKSLAESTVKTGSNLLLSTVCPGWGLTRLSNGKPYWLLGVAGYGCIAASYYLNRQAYSNYQKYKSSADAYKTKDMDAYFNTGKSQYTASNVLALSAITLWIADLGITWIKASKMKRSVAGAKSASFSVGSSYDYGTNTPRISIYYTF
jgi:predicted protein tyrosine phosphatase